MSRDTLEIGAQYDVTVGDITMFDRYMAQHQPYYHNYSTKLPEGEFPFSDILVSSTLSWRGCQPMGGRGGSGKRWGTG